MYAVASICGIKPRNIEAFFCGLHEIRVVPLNMSICEQCNTEITAEPMKKGEYGGDWHFSCPICEWYSESEVSSTIKDGLSREELVEHKRKLNIVYDKMLDLVITMWRDTKGASSIAIEEIMEELREAKKQLLDIEIPPCPDTEHE